MATHTWMSYCIQNDIYIFRMYTPSVVPQNILLYFKPKYCNLVDQFKQHYGLKTLQRLLQHNSLFSSVLFIKSSFLWEKMCLSSVHRHFCRGTTVQYSTVPVLHIFNPHPLLRSFSVWRINQVAGTKQMQGPAKPTWTETNEKKHS